MQIEEFIKTIHTLEKLKDTTRHCYTSGGRRESVAEHTWRAAMMAYFMKDEFPNADISKVITMILIHDLGEIFTGDIPAFDKNTADESTEQRLLFDWVASLPKPYCDEMMNLYNEMLELETEEAKLYKALDGIEAVLQHNESEISTWSDIEFTLNRVYAEDRCAFSEYLTQLRKAINMETDQKIAECKNTDTMI